MLLAGFAAFGALPIAGAGTAAADPPKLGKLRPAPPIPANAPPLPPAQFDEALAIDGEDIKAKKVETRLMVDVHVNGRGPYQFLVDSGADTSVVGVRIAQQLKLPLGTPAILNAMTDRKIVDRVQVDELTLGPSTVRNLELPVLREADLGSAGILGIDALVEQRLMMDFEQKVIKAEDATVRYKPQPGEIVVTARRHRGQLILTEVRAGKTTLNAVIDTGSQISIGNSLLREKLLRNKKVRFWTVPVTGVTGHTVDLQLATIPHLELGSVTLVNVPVAFADVPPFQVFGIDQEPGLLLGTDILETFRRISLDFADRKVRFQLRRCRSSGVVLSTSQTRLITGLSSTRPEACHR